MNALWPLAYITFKEGVRNRAFYGISIIALLMLAANFLISGVIMQDVGKVAVDIALSAVSFSGLLVVFFVGINLLAKDLDRKTIYMVLSKPISRSQYIWGKFFGIVLLMLATMLFLGSFALLSIFLVKLGYPQYFPRFAWSPIFLALVYSMLSLIILVALSVLFSSFSSTSFITLVLTIIAYLIGQSVADVKALIEMSVTKGEEVSALTLKVVQFAYYAFPNLSLFDLKIQAAHNLPVAPEYLLWASVYFFVYTGLIVPLAALIFKRREFP